MNIKHLITTAALIAATLFVGIFDAKAQQSELAKYKKPTTEKVRHDRARNIVLPKSDGHYRQTSPYVEDAPDNDYIHASEKAYESFRDIKFSVRIHWGVYSKWNIEASWPLLNMSNEKKQEYQSLYKTFNPVDFDANEWMDWFKRCGMQAFAFTTKHHDGFSMWHTATRVKRRANYLNPPESVIEDCDLAYSIEETPFRRDIVKELCDAAHRKGIKIDLYFSHPDWYDADFRPYVNHPLTALNVKEQGSAADGMNFDEKKIVPPNRTPEETARMIARHREQLRELLTNYGKIDMICLDMWLGKDVWQQIKETMKLARHWSPETMFRARGIGNYGDYFQPEQFVPGDKENTGMPWMSICLLGKLFACDPVAENYKGAGWVIHNLIDCVAKGGSFMVCVGPDETGKFHPVAVKQLEEVGDWLRINGEGIYETRECSRWKENEVWFTRSKNSKRVYAFVQKWTSEKTLLIPSVTPRKGSRVHMFGYKKPLKWTQTEQGVRLEIPAELQSPENLPCQHAWGFKFDL
jgi:alpha-L-fucosidase